MDVMNHLKSFDNVISAIDYLHQHLHHSSIHTNFDLGRLRLIGINACDNESNTYLWHINALIHASIDLDHLLLGLEMMLHRFIKPKHISNNINTSQISHNAHSIVTIGDDGSHFLRLKSRTPSRSPKKRTKISSSSSKRNHPLHIPSAATTTNINNQSIDEIANIANMASKNINNNNNSNVVLQDLSIIENIDNIDINDINSIISKEALNINNNKDNNSTKGEIPGMSGIGGMSGLFGSGNQLEIMQGPIKIADDSADYIAQLLVSPDSTRLNSPSRAAMSAVETAMIGADDMFAVKVQSSPNASRMKRIKRIRQQERNYQNKLDLNDANINGIARINNINNNNKNSSDGLNELNGLNELSEIKSIVYNGTNNGENETNVVNTITNTTNTTTSDQGVMEMSPFEISKFVKQVDQLQI